MSTHSLSKEEAINSRCWVLVDAAGMTVGRLSSNVASLLRGKHKVCFTRHVDAGDFVVVINAEKIKFSGRKLEQKVYHNYSGYVGGDKVTTAGDMMKKNPCRVISTAVQGMLPKGPLGRDMLTKLKVYVGTAQAPVTLTTKSMTTGSQAVKA